MSQLPVAMTDIIMLGSYILYGANILKRIVIWEKFCPNIFI